MYYNKAFGDRDEIPVTYRLPVFQSSAIADAGDRFSLGNVNQMQYSFM